MQLLHVSGTARIFHIDSDIFLVVVEGAKKPGAPNKQPSG
jgi:hypothetical protein